METGKEGTGMLYKSKYKSPLGMITIVCNEKVLLEAGLETQACLLAESAQSISRNEIATVCGTGAGEAGIKGKKTETEDAGRKNALELMKRVLNWFDLYFAGKKPDPRMLPLAPRGSEFRQMVWQELLEIPYGKTTTYGAIAGTVARKLHKEKMSAQAVGGAVGHNPVAIIIPCHRVVGSNGCLTGYAGGLDIKYKLLRHEGADMDSFFLPK